MIFSKKIVFFCATIVMLFTPISQAGNNAPELRSMEKLNIENIDKFARYAARKLVQVDYRHLGKKLSEIKTLSTAQFYEQYRQRWGEKSPNAKRLIDERIISEPKKLGDVLVARKPFMHTFLVPVESYVSSLKGSGARQQTLQLMVVNTPSGLRVARFSVKK